MDRSAAPGRLWDAIGGTRGRDHLEHTVEGSAMLLLYAKQYAIYEKPIQL